MCSIAALLNDPPHSAQHAASLLERPSKRARVLPLDSLLNESYLSEHSSPVSSIETGLDVATRLARARAAGSTHRNNRIYAMRQMEFEIVGLREENSRLQTRVTIFSKSDAGKQAISRLHTFLYSPLYHRAALPLTNSAAAVLGMDDLPRVSGATAAVLLETMAARRNLITTGVRSRCRDAQSVSTSIAVRVVRHALDEFAREANALCAPSALWVTMCTQLLRHAHDMWSAHELEGEPADADHDSALHAVVEHSDGGGRGHGPKKCSRCRKIKSAGNGHRRSNCDDGLPVSSSIPYVEDVDEL